MKIIFVITATILFTSTSSFAQWTQQYQTSQAYFYSVFMGDLNNGYAVGTNTSSTGGKIYRTTNGGQNWTEVPGQGNNLYSVWFSAPNIGFAVGSSGTIIKSTDGGNSWTERTSGTTKGLKSILFTDENTGWAVGGHNLNGVVILKTTNQGETWNEQTCSEIGVLNDECFINNNVGWAVGKEQLTSPNLVDRPIVVKTTNGGDTWSSLNIGIEDCQLRTVFFLNENVGWVGGAREYNYPSDPLVVLLKTTNGGNSWVSQISNKHGVINSLRMCDSDKGWAVGYGDVWGNQYGLNYETTDGGNDWTHITSLNDMKLNYLFFLNPTTGWATALNKIYKYQITSGIYDGYEVPSNFSLEQNYPNPFNPSTKISYSIPQTSNVAIKVFDLLGNEIETLVNEEKPAGTYEITWYGENLPSGIYFYRLQAGGFVETKKMLLLK